MWNVGAGNDLSLIPRGMWHLKAERIQMTTFMLFNRKAILDASDAFSANGFIKGVDLI